MNAANERDQDLVPLGYVAGIFGIKGWVKIHSWTSPREAILEYQPWLLGDELVPLRITDGRPQGKTVVVSLPGVVDRETAAEWVGREIRVYRDQLPKTQEKQYYWSDLVGLEVKNKDGADLGRITSMMETGAHDVMIVQGDRERIIPFVPDHYVISVDLEKDGLVVDWDPDYLA